MRYTEQRSQRPQQPPCRRAASPASEALWALCMGSALVLGAGCAARQAQVKRPPARAARAPQQPAKQVRAQPPAREHTRRQKGHDAPYVSGVWIPPQKKPPKRTASKPQTRKLTAKERARRQAIRRRLMKNVIIGLIGAKSRKGRPVQNVLRSNTPYSQSLDDALKNAKPIRIGGKKKRSKPAPRQPLDDIPSLQPAPSKAKKKARKDAKKTRGKARK